jgi:hypothetical protein
MDLLQEQVFRMKEIMYGKKFNKEKILKEGAFLKKMVGELVQTTFETIDNISITFNSKKINLEDATNKLKSTVDNLKTTLDDGDWKALKNIVDSADDIEKKCTNLKNKIKEYENELKIKVDQIEKLKNDILSNKVIIAENIDEFVNNNLYGIEVEVLANNQVKILKKGTKESPIKGSTYWFLETLCENLDVNSEFFNIEFLKGYPTYEFLIDKLDKLFKEKIKEQLPIRAKKPNETTYDYELVKKESINKHNYLNEKLRQHVKIFRGKNNNKTLQEVYNNLVKVKKDETGIVKNLNKEYDELYTLLKNKVNKEGYNTLTQEEKTFMDDVLNWNKNIINDDNLKISYKNAKKRNIKNLDPEIIKKYERILKNKNEGKKISKTDEEFLKDVDDWLNGDNVNLNIYKYKKLVIGDIDKTIRELLRNPNIKIKYTELIRKILKKIGEKENYKYIVSTMDEVFGKEITPENLKELLEFLKTQKGLSDFVEKLESKEIGYLADKDGNWIQISMLDTNFSDATNLIRDILEEVLEVEGLTLDDFFKLSKEMQITKLKEVMETIQKEEYLPKIIERVEKNQKWYTKNSQVQTEIGDAAEIYARKKLEESGYEVLFFPKKKGNALDKKNVDVVVRKDGKFYIVQVKATKSNIFTKLNSKGKKVISFYQTSPIYLSDGLVAVVNGDKIVIYPPEAVSFKIKDKTTGKQYTLKGEFCKTRRMIELDMDKVIYQNID